MAAALDKRAAKLDSGEWLQAGRPTLDWDHSRYSVAHERASDRVRSTATFTWANAKSNDAPLPASTKAQLRARAEEFLASIPAAQKLLHGQLVEVAPTLLQSKWRSWQMGTPSAFVAGRVVQAQEPVLLDDPRTGGVIAEAHVEAFDDASAAAVTVVEPWRGVLMRFTLKMVRAGVYKQLTSAVNEAVDVVYMLDCPLVSTPGLQHMNQRNTKAYTFLRLDWVHKALGVDVAKANIVITELNPAAHGPPKQDGSMGEPPESLSTRYEDVCAKSILASLQLGAAMYVAFGSSTATRWKQQAEKIKDANTIVEVWQSPRADHTAHGLRFSFNGKVRTVVLSPHPSHWRDLRGLTDAMAFVHNSSAEQRRFIKVIADSRVFAMDLLTAVTKVPATCSTVINIEIDAPSDAGR